MTEVTISRCVMNVMTRSFQERESSSGSPPPATARRLPNGCPHPHRSGDRQGVDPLLDHGAGQGVESCLSQAGHDVDPDVDGVALQAPAVEGALTPAFGGGAGLEPGRQEVDELGRPGGGDHLAGVPLVGQLVQLPADLALGLAVDTLPLAGSVRVVPDGDPGLLATVRSLAHVALAVGPAVRPGLASLGHVRLISRGSNGGSARSQGGSRGIPIGPSTRIMPTWRVKPWAGTTARRLSGGKGTCPAWSTGTRSRDTGGRAAVALRSSRRCWTSPASRPLGGISSAAGHEAAPGASLVHFHSRVANGQDDRVPGSAPVTGRQRTRPIPVRVVAIRRVGPAARRSP